MYLDLFLGFQLYSIIWFLCPSYIVLIILASEYVSTSGRASSPWRFPFLVFPGSSSMFAFPLNFFSPTGVDDSDKVINEERQLSSEFTALLQPAANNRHLFIMKATHQWIYMAGDLAVLSHCAGSVANKPQMQWQLQENMTFSYKSQPFGKEKSW